MTAPLSYECLRYLHFLIRTIRTHQFAPERPQLPVSFMIRDKAGTFKGKSANQEAIAVSLLKGAKYLGRFMPSEASA